MKIYAGSRYKSDEDIFRSLIDKDVWVKVDQFTCEFHDFRLQYIHLFKDIIGIGWNSVYASFIDNYDASMFRAMCELATRRVSNSDISALEKYILRGSGYFFGNSLITDEFELIRPFETYSTEEIFGIIEDMYGDK